GGGDRIRRRGGRLGEVAGKVVSWVGVVNRRFGKGERSIVLVAGHQIGIPRCPRATDCRTSRTLPPLAILFVDCIFDPARNGKRHSADGEWRSMLTSFRMTSQPDAFPSAGEGCRRPRRRYP